MSWVLVDFRLIIKLSFKLTFWTRIDIKSSCSHFQFNLSRVAHIFNLTWLNSTENWVNLTRLVKNLSLMSRELNIEIFPIFCFCIIFLIESHDEKHEDYMIESHEEKSWRKVMMRNHEDCLIERFDRKSWREIMKRNMKKNMKIVWLW